MATLAQFIDSIPAAKFRNFTDVPSVVFRNEKYTVDVAAISSECDHYSLEVKAIGSGRVLAFIVVERTGHAASVEFRRALKQSSLERGRKVELFDADRIVIRLTDNIVLDLSDPRFPLF